MSDQLDVLVRRLSADAFVDTSLCANQSDIIAVIDGPDATPESEMRKIIATRPEFY